MEQGQANLYLQFLLNDIPARGILTPVQQSNLHRYGQLALHTVNSTHLPENNQIQYWKLQIT